MAIKRRASGVLHRKVAELEEALGLREAMIRAIRDKVRLIKMVVKEKKAKVVTKAKLKSIGEYMLHKSSKMKSLRALRSPTSMASMSARSI